MAFTMRRFWRREIRFNKFGEWWFTCRRCKTVGLPHYFHESAWWDRGTHACSGPR
jgi:hypothetical protein